MIPHLQVWAFRVADGETAEQMCAKDASPTGGPVVMVQDQAEPGESQTFDIDHLC